MENNIQIFNNSEFGNIRTTMIDGEPWFVGKDVATALGYAKPLGAIATHVSEDDSLKQGLTDSLGRTQEAIFINESGLYALIFGSKLESAKKFKSWVTKDVLPSIRKTGSYSVPAPMSPLEQLQLQAQAILQVNEKVEALDKKIERFELDLPILPIEADRITEAVRKRGVDILGGKGSHAYQDRSMRQRVYSNIYADLKANFRVRSYKSIKRNQCDSALNVIARYDAPLYLQDEIYMMNGQRSIWDD